MTDTAPAAAGDGLLERIVAGTMHSWTLPNPIKPGEALYFNARHGERIRVTEAEAARGEAMGTLVDEEVARQNQLTRDQLLAEISRLQAEVDETRAAQPPAILQPPPAPAASTTLTPSMSGVPQAAPPPTNVGPIGPTNADAVAAAVAATKGNPIVEVTPTGAALTHTGVIHPTTTTVAGVLPGEKWDDERLTSANREEVVAYLGQWSNDEAEVERVDELEAGRARGPRKTVTDVIDRIRAGEEE